jgi:serine protease
MMIVKALQLTLMLAIPCLALATTEGSGQISSLKISAVAGTEPREEMVSRLIVKPRHGSGDQLKSALLGRDASGLARISKAPMSFIRPMSGDAHVINLDQPVTLAEARVIAARLMQDDSVEVAEPDRFKRPLAVTPSDPDYASNQRNLFISASPNQGSVNMPGAWGITLGSNQVTVAVLDTGYRPHADLANAILPGYTFITNATLANNGWGPDAQDPGDWISGAENTTRRGAYYGCGALDSRNRPLNQLSPSSWHGTHVTGIIAAQMNNGIGITGIAPSIKILPVRVLGKCGGYDSDIIDGMRWAAGLAVANAPANPHPAQVLNLSLGGSGGTPCPASYQSAVTDIIKAGKVIVVAGGNDGSATLSTPANCTGVIAVTANAIDGDNAWYATIGPGTTLSAPGGDCGGMNQYCASASYPGIYSLLNSGTTNPVASPAGDIYVAYSGTSMATPHVAAVAALMFSVNPALTPAQIASYLQSSARPFPPDTICTQTANVGLCGAGLLDAYQALLTVHPASISAPVVSLGSIASVVAPGDTVTLSGSAVAGAGRSITSYVWTQQSGPTTLVLNNPDSATASFTAPAVGVYTFMLTVTDDAGLTGIASTAALTVNSPPVLNAVPALTVTTGAALNFIVTASDVDGDTLIFHAISLPAGATLSATGNFSWPNATPAGSYTLVYYASDVYNQNSPQATVNINVANAGITVKLVTGWNLIGNGIEAPMSVSTLFHDATQVSTLWKWVNSGNTAGVSYPAWAFYSPQLSDGGQAYAASKGYEFLTTIKAGEGFWVNAGKAFSVQLPSGSAVQSSAFNPASGAHALAFGWSLIAIGDSLTPTQFNAQLSVTPPLIGPIPQNVATLWAWDATLSGWYFWAPGLVNSGSLAGYLVSKNYLDSSKLPTLPAGSLAPATGFWVNR